jgi:pyrroloquinoline quinone (PQQ) biosynthesis protein C
MDRWLRIAGALGLERKAKRVDPLEAVRMAVAAANEERAS